MIVTSGSGSVTDTLLRGVLTDFPYIETAILFGSVAQGKQRPDSDLDVAVQARHALTAEQKISIISALAVQTGRPVDLIDLKLAGEPLLGQILKHGRRLVGSNAAFAQLLSKHLFDQADFMPYRNRILAERRARWIGM